MYLSVFFVFSFYCFGSVVFLFGLRINWILVYVVFFIELNLWIFGNVIMLLKIINFFFGVERVIFKI